MSDSLQEHTPVTIVITDVGNQETINNAPIKKSLRSSGRVAKDKENSTGKFPKNEVPNKKKKTVPKKPPTKSKRKVTAEDLTEVDESSEIYWELLAEKRRVALEETLEENEKLWKMMEAIQEENAAYKQMLQEANSFIEVFKEAVDDSNDTGIDVNDVSAADETVNDDSKSEKTDNQETSK